MNTVGTHIICELSGCDELLLSDVEAIRREMIQGAVLAAATVIRPVFHIFEPQGVSGVVVLAESHLSIHTWPEHRYAALDFYTCGPHTTPVLAFSHMEKYLKAESSYTTTIIRGLPWGDTYGHTVTRSIL